MDKYVVVIFPDETKAYEGVRALKELDAEGSLTVYGTGVVAKDTAGKLSVKEAADKGPLGTAVGALVGVLVGMFAGPIGAAAGMVSGAALGGIYDIANLGISSNFVDEISRNLTPGKSAVIAEVDEEWVTPLDTRMEAIGGSVMRELRASVEDEYYTAQVNARKAELARLKEELAHAKQERRATMQARVDEASARLQEAADRLQCWLDDRQEETSAKVNALSERAAKSRSDMKSRFDSRVAALREDLGRRKAKLGQAYELARESDELTAESLRP